MRTTTIEGLPAWARARRTVGLLVALVVVAAFGASGALSAAQASEEPALPPLTAEPAQGAMPEPDSAQVNNWTTFIGDGPCPEGANASRATISPDATNPAVVVFVGAVQPLEPGADAQSTTATSWISLRTGAASAYFSEPNSYEVLLRCGTTALSTAQWRTAQPAYSGLLTFNDEEWRVTSGVAATPTVVNLTALADGEETDEIQAGTEVEVRAAVTPADAAGEVELFNTNSDGEPTSLDTATVSGGTATFTLDDVAAGEYTLAGVFTPDDEEAYETSPLSSEIPLTVLAADAEDTTTTLTVSPESPVEPGAEVTLTATVAPTEAAGDVQFNAGGEPVGEPVAVAEGTATLTTTELPEGALMLTASFSPDDLEAFSPSTSAPVTYTVGDAGPQVTAVDADGNALGENPTLEDGQVVTLTAPGFAAEEDVTVTLDAESESPQELGDPIPADEEGAVTTEFTAASLEPGQHQLNFVGATSELDLAWQFQMAGDTGEEDGTEDGEEDGEEDGTEDGGAADGTADGTADGAAGGNAGGSNNPSGSLAQTGAFLIGPAALLGLAAVSAGYAFMRRSRSDELLTFDDTSATCRR